MEPIDLNTATTEKILLLRGIGRVKAARIIAARPYRSPDELVTRNIVSVAIFDKIARSLSIGSEKRFAPRNDWRPQDGGARRGSQVMREPSVLGGFACERKGV